jgi:LPS-assembly protein
MSAQASPYADCWALRRARLLAGAAALVLAAVAQTWATPVLAQELVQTAPAEMPTVPNKATLGPVGPDGLVDEQLYVEADSVIQDKERNVLTARGNVQARYQGRTLRAEVIVYDGNTGLVTANGKAQIINDDGTVQYAEHVELDDKLRAGAASGFAARLEGNGKLAAASAVRRSESINELNRAIFTPCPICAPDGRPHQPTWSIQAEKIIQDRDKKLVYYRNAVIKVLGVPVFYTPVFWHPDPSAERASGLLMPKASVSDRRGLSYEQPYLWQISPSQDLVISPQLNVKVNPFLNLDYRKRFHSGHLEARLGYTYERNFGDFDIDQDGTIESDERDKKYGDLTSRSYILADGEFNITKAWRWGFTAERASDDSIFDRYDIGDIYNHDGLFENDSRRLTSQLYTVRQTERSYLSVALVDFQSLRRGFYLNPDTGLLVKRAENDAALPIVAPLIEARWEPEGPVLGGRLRVTGSAVALERDEARLDPFRAAPISGPPPTNPADPCFPDITCEGVDSRRASGQVDWRSAFTTRGGIRFEPFLNARADVYNFSDLPGSGKTSMTVSRAFATAGVDITYPLVKSFGDSTMVLEPIGQLAVSPKSDIDPRLIAYANEDSRVFNFDETNLFRTDKSPGFDLYEGGARANIGVRGTWNWGDGRWARALIGRAFRVEAEEAYPPGVSVGDTSSDWIVAASAQPIAGVVAFGRARLSDAGDINRMEAGVNWDFQRTRGYLRYLKDETNPFLPTGRREDMDAAGEFLFTHNWGVVFDGTRDLEQRLWRRAEIGILYQDDCTRVELVYQRNETSVLGPTDAVFLRLNLATLGDAGYKRYDDR